jgi:mycothiol synthase
MPSELDRLTPQLVMERGLQDGLPPLQPPAGYTVRSLRRGDEAAWVRIIAASFELEPAPDYFDRRMRDDASFAPERILFSIGPDGPVATASAWHRPAWGATLGILHMVGALPSHRGRGLGHLVCLAALHYLADEGRTAVVLQTDDFRLAAVRAYLRLGFVPRLVHDNQRERWPRVLAQVAADGWRERFAAALAGPVREL